jgi:hypothetical protein
MPGEYPASRNGKYQFPQTASPRWLIACASIASHKPESGSSPFFFSSFVNKRYTKKAFLYLASFTFLMSFPSAMTQDKA